MPPESRPTAYLSWVPDEASVNLARPPRAISDVGFQAGQPLPAQYLNYALHNLDRWVQVLDENSNSTLLATTLNHSMRLLGGGTLSFDASTRVLAWSGALTLAVPSAQDTSNVLPAGSLMLPAGSVAYVQINLPFTTTADVTAGSTSVVNLGYEAGITVGMGVRGAGIADNTTVTAIKGSSCTLSQAATASASQETLTFVSSGPLQAMVADSASLIPGPNTVIVARATELVCSVGIGSTEVWLRDKEQRSLVAAGYVSTVRAQAGEALTARQAVYLSQGTADSRTSGAAYRADASSAQGPLRGQVLGLVHTAANQGAQAHVVCSGLMAGFSGLIPGALYYLDPQTPGAITAAAPSGVGQYTSPVGLAQDASTLLVRPSRAQPVTRPGSFAVVDLGSIWATRYSEINLLKKTVYNITAGSSSTVGVVDRIWPATQAGAVVSVSGRYFISTSDANIALYIGKNSMQTPFIIQPLTYTANQWTNITLQFAEGTYPFNAGDTLYAYFGNNTTQPILQADISITTKLYS